MNLLAELNALGIKVTVAGDDLLIDAPTGALTEELTATIKANKPRLLKALAPWTVVQAKKLIARYPDPFDLWREFYAWVDRKIDEGYTTDYLLACEAVLMAEWKASRQSLAG